MRSTRLEMMVDGGDDPSIHLSIESDRNLNVGDLSTRKIDSTRSLCLDHVGEKQITTSGTCIICFEEFVKDDVIVWSENETCNHVYHKDCMVNYLASNAERHITTMKLDDNPCP